MMHIVTIHDTYCWIFVLRYIVAQYCYTLTKYILAFTLENAKTFGWKRFKRFKTIYTII